VSDGRVNSARATGDALRIGADELGHACSDSLWSLSGVAHDQRATPKCRRLFLDAARVGEHQ